MLRRTDTLISYGDFSAFTGGGKPQCDPPSSIITGKMCTRVEPPTYR